MSIVKFRKVKFRKVNLTDPEEMQTIAAIDISIPAIFDPLFQVNETTINERLERLLKAKSDDFFHVAINEKNQIIGYHYLYKFKTSHGIMAAYNETIWVDPDFRNQGIAKSLKLMGEEWAKEEKLDHISTFVHCKNEAMLALNKNLDYKIFGYKLNKKL